MTKKKNIFVKLFVALVALTLISCCFLGSTFARYTSGGDGSATVNVANWQIGISGNGVGSTTMSFGNLSPSGKANTVENRQNSTGRILVATITNNGEVNASVTVTLGEYITFYGLTPVGGTEASSTEVSSWGDYSKEEVEALFTLKLYYATQEGTENATKPVTSGTAISDPLAPTKSYYIYAEVVWTSGNGEDGDALDTWVGQNVGSVNWSLSYTAVQASDLPTA